jgi:hypothetical protein
MVYLNWKVGDPIAFLTIHKTLYYWDQVTPNIFLTLKGWVTNVWVAYQAHNWPAMLRYLTEDVAFLFGVAMTVLGAKKLPWEFTLYSSLSLAVFLLSNAHSSLVRYLLPLFPIYLTLSLYQSKEINRVWLIGGGILMGLMATLFSAFYFMIGG